MNSVYCNGEVNPTICDSGNNSTMQTKSFHGNGLCSNNITASTKKSVIAAVVVRNAYKSYDIREPILKDFNMTVQSGTIYSLLGSSGCGKTTLLACCVGLRRLDRGLIRVLGSRSGVEASSGGRIGVPGKLVGYMPQELSLYGEFTIQESLVYFGQLYGMSPSKIKANMEFVIKLLELPSYSRIISTLSGGQKRRVSFALAIFHEAPLLILDEPTVGVDPLLRESIWNYLCKLVDSKKTTVIITTHYIEEARQSHTVGVMRNGRLLVEKPPELLISELRVSLLEQAVLTLCRSDNDNADDDHPPTYSSSDYSYNATECCSDGTVNLSGKTVTKDTVVGLKYLEYDEKSWTEDGREGQSQSPNCDNTHEKESCAKLVQKDFRSMINRLKALILKNWIVLLRNVWFLLFVFVVPSTQVILICLAIGPDPKHLHIGVVDHEVNFSSEICKPQEGCVWVDLSCRYLSLLPNQTFNLIPFETEEDALHEIQSGSLWGYVAFPKNYSASLQDRIASSPYSEDATLNSSRIVFELDMSNKQIGQTMKKIFLDVFQTFMEDLAIKCGNNPRQTELPLDFKIPVYGTDDTSFSEFLAPSVLLGLLFFFPLCSSGVSYITEKKSGTLDRSLVAGVTNAEIMIAYLISQSAILVTQSCLAFFILTFVFKIEVNGSYFWAITLVILIGVGGMSMGFLISTICTEEIQAVLLAIGSFFPNFILAGMVWPIQGMPVILQYVAYLLPCTLACESMRSMVTRGWSITHPDVWPGFVSTIAWICIYWTLTILIHHFSNRR